jgi:hypothetical protein
MDLCNYDGFPLLFVELGHRHGGGSPTLCYRGGVKSDAYPCRRCDARHRHGKMVPYAWIRHPDWFHVVAARLSGQRHGSFLACHHYHV